MKPNINFEDDYLPLIEDKNEVSKRALNTLEKVMFSQDDYGFDKYKKALRHTMKYDWLQMALEEEADKLKYIQNEIDRKKDVIEMLEKALGYESWALVETAVKILKTKGTGK